jgi:hypothetical protein
LHMGYPLANGAVYAWMESEMGGKWDFELPWDVKNFYIS